MDKPTAKYERVDVESLLGLSKSVRSATRRKWLYAALAMAALAIAVGLYSTLSGFTRPLGGI